MIKNGMAAVLFIASAAQFTGKLLNAEFYYDLGPDTIDVSTYPKKYQETYKIFSKACSQCHTLARPINTPFVTSQEWYQHIHRMQFRTRTRSWAKLPPRDLALISEFLVYDAQIRKVKDKDRFEAQTKDLKELFKEIQAAKSQLREKR